MPRELEKHQLYQRSLIKKFRRELWNPFVAAVKNYRLIEEGDRVAVIVSGSAKSVLLALLIKQLHRVSDFPFEFVLIAGDGADIDKLSADFQLDLIAFQGDFSAAAKEFGCSKIALDFTGTQAVLALLSSMFFGHKLQSVLPKERAGEQQIIRPLYCIFDDAVGAFIRYNNLDFQPPAADDERAAKLLAELKQKNPGVEKNIFNSLHAVCLETLPGYTSRGIYHDFNETYKLRENENLTAD